jgi:hydrogenase-4 component F
MQGALKGYKGKKGAVFWVLVSLFFLAVISLPPSPMFFSELYGFGSMINLAKKSDYLLGMLGAIFILLVLLSVIFYKFIEIYQDMKYKGQENKKVIYSSELISLAIFAICLVVLLTPSVMNYLKGIS